MVDTPPDSRRRVPVRLCDIDVERRLAAARWCCRYEVDEDEKLALLFAAVTPSTRVYWVAD